MGLSPVFVTTHIDLSSSVVRDSTRRRVQNGGPYGQFNNAEVVELIAAFSFHQTDIDRRIKSMKDDA